MNTSSLHCVNENKVMAPTRRNGVSFVRTGPDSGDRRAEKRAHSAPGRDATSRLYSSSSLVLDV